jgi:translocator protein
MDLKNIFFVVGLVLVFVYVIGSGLWVDNSGWYQSLNKPRWQPPEIVFGIIWPYNFVVLTIAIFQITRGANARQIMLLLTCLAVSVFAALAWSYFFYHPHNFNVATLSLITSAIFTLPIVAITFSVSIATAIALIPYQIWLILASALSFSYGKLN